MHNTLHKKNFIERLDSVEKLINIWSARGLSLYGKITVTKSLIIPKFAYIASLLTTPMGVIQELNRLIFKFLWKGVDKVTRLSTITIYQKSGLKMIDLETILKSLRLSWLKRIFNKNVINFILNYFNGGQSSEKSFLQRNYIKIPYLFTYKAHSVIRRTLNFRRRL